MGFVADVREWANSIFGGCDLGDARRVDRLVDYAARQAVEPAASTSAACKGDSAAHEGSYKLLRNPNVRPADIDDGAFDAVAEHAENYELVLAIQDSTGLSFKHPTAKALGREGSPSGFVVHSTLLVDAHGPSVIGIVDQDRWIREPKSDKKERDSRTYGEKESFKWEAANRRMRERLRDISRVITVCDREADIYDFLRYMKDSEQRFVQRSSADRTLETNNGRLWDTLEKSPAIGGQVVLIRQRGGQLGGNGQSARLARPAREAYVTIRAARVSICPPVDRKDEPAVSVNAVLVREENAPAGETPVEWMLLTTEPVASPSDVERAISYYAKRWLIEEFHKAWKTGCRIEERPMQNPDNLERIAAITAHIATRVLQLRNLTAVSPHASCEGALQGEEWRCLWATTMQRKFPSKTPTLHWALNAIARLAGWQDTKRTGQIGWLTLWHGWEILQDRMVAWRAAMASVGGACR